jgi:PAS domain-containing protein
LGPEDNPVTFTVLVERALLNRGIVYDDVRVKLRSGKSVWLRLHGIPITISGRIAAVEMLASDITFYKKTQEILEQNRKLWTGLMDALKQNPDGNRICRTAKDGEQ